MTALLECQYRSFRKKAQPVNPSDCSIRVVDNPEIYFKGYLYTVSEIWIIQTYGPPLVPRDLDITEVPLYIY